MKALDIDGNLLRPINMDIKQFRREYVDSSGSGQSPMDDIMFYNRRQNF
jgi:hypothetical protein